MNTREMYVFYDTVSGQFGEPFSMANDAEVKRYFDNIVVNPSVPSYAINDTVVLHLGTFVCDGSDPKIVPAPIVCCVIRGGNYNVEKIRSETGRKDSAASELCTSEDC